MKNSNSGSVPPELSSFCQNSKAEFQPLLSRDFWRTVVSGVFTGAVAKIITLSQKSPVVEGEHVRMHLNLLSGASIDMQVNLDSSVNVFRKCVMETDNLYQCNGQETILLLFAGKGLSDGHTLRSYKIPADACIQVLSVSPICWHSCGRSMHALTLSRLISGARVRQARVCGPSRSHQLCTQACCSSRNQTQN